MPPAWSRLLSHRRFFLVPLLCGALLTLSTLNLEFFADDCEFVAALESPAHPLTAWRLYEFASGNPGANYELVRRGVFPWWSAPDLKLRFLRPLSSAMFSLDHAMFGQRTLGYHLDTLIWFLLLLIAVGALLRNVLSPPIAGLAFLLYALSTTHAEPVAWLASRHMLIASAPAVAGLAGYVGRRERGLPSGRRWAVLGLLVGLLGGEAALSVAVYWMAYEAIGAPDLHEWRSRAHRVALPLGLMVSYLVVYKSLGYGVAGSAAYLDVLESPGGFAIAIARRLPILLAELFLGLPSALANMLFPTAAMVLGVLASLLVAWLLRSVWSEVPAATKRALRWLGVGSILSLLITVGGVPGSRLVLIPGIGGFAVIATVLGLAWPRFIDRPQRDRAVLGRRAGWLVLLALHVVISPLAFVTNALALGKIGAATTEIADSLDHVLDALQRPSGKLPVVFVLTASDPMAGIYVGASHEMRAPGKVGSWVMLSISRATHTIQRTADGALVIRADPSMMRGMFEGVFRADDMPFRPGDRTTLDDAIVTVLSTDQGRPVSIEVRPRTLSLDDPALCLLAWEAGHLIPVHLAANETIEIPWSPGPSGVF